jgi:predicted ATPase
VKGELLSFLLAKAGLFENVKMASVTESATVLDKLFRDFADAKLSGLRSEPNNAFDGRVQPLAEGDTFSLDALSSGQKEMITTLFLTWHHTRDNPGLVLIDEPELHLNAEWQIKFVRLLFKLAPQNQYIFATHSEFVFRSVQEDRRILIGPQG